MLSNFIGIDTALYNLAKPEQLFEQVEMLYKSLPCHLHCKDLSGKYIACNNRVANDCGLDNTADLIGLTDFDFNFLPQDKADEFVNQDTLVRKDKKPQLFIHSFTLADHQNYSAMTYKFPLFSLKKKVIGSMAISLVAENATSCLNVQNESKKFNSVKLTVRQIECLTCLVKGMNTKQIGQKLNLSPRTIEDHLNAAKCKLNCYDRTELVATALQLQVIRTRL